MKDEKLTEIMFRSLQKDPKLFSYEEWINAGDFAIEMRFFPHALSCYQMAAEINKDDNVLNKMNDIIDKITNVLELVPEKLKEEVEEIRLSNPLDPAKWLAMANKLLKDASAEIAAGNVDSEIKNAAIFALAFASYCALRSLNDVESINEVLLSLLDSPDQVSVDLKLDLKAIREAKDKEAAIKVVAFGDNITLGLQPDWSINFQETYHYLWAKEVGSDSKYNVSLANNAISGAGVLDLLLYLTRDIVYFQPDIALIMLGNNDAWLGKAVLPAYEVLLQSAVEMMKSKGIKVVLVSPVAHIPSACLEEQRPNDIDLKEVEIDDYALVMKRVAAKTNVVFVDSFAKFPRDEEQRSKFFVNGFNQPNLAGQRLVQEALSEMTLT